MTRSKPSARQTTARPAGRDLKSGKRSRGTDDGGAAKPAKRTHTVRFPSKLETGPTSSSQGKHPRNTNPSSSATTRSSRSGNGNSRTNHDADDSLSEDDRDGGLREGGYANPMPSRSTLGTDDTGIARDVGQTRLQAGEPFGRHTPRLAITPRKVPKIVERKGDEVISSNPSEYIILSAVPNAADIVSAEEKDHVVASRFAQIVAATKALAEAFPAETLNDLPSGPELETFKRGLLGSEEHSHTIRYIGCLALGGPEGFRSWYRLFQNAHTRQALVMGMVGRALKEHVFSDVWFGGSDAEKRELQQIDQDLDGDGFSRTRYRASLCARFQTHYDNDDTTSAATSLGKAITKISLQIERLLLPLFNIRAHALALPPPFLRLPLAHHTLLLAIAEQAALLSRFTRLLPNVLYYSPPTFKDEEFEPARMECLNLAAMIRASPYTKDCTDQGYDRAKLNPNQESRAEAIVRVVAFPGIVAYRQGGGALAQGTLERERSRGRHEPPDVAARRRADGVSEASGFRTKLIAKAVVQLDWGRQRLLTKEAGTSRHLDALRDGTVGKYDADSRGFVELWDVFGEVQREETRGEGAVRAVRVE